MKIKLSKDQEGFINSVGCVCITYDIGKTSKFNPTVYTRLEEDEEGVYDCRLINELPKWELDNLGVELKYTEEDMRICFEMSKLTNDHPHFNNDVYKTFEDYIKTVK